MKNLTAKKYNGICEEKRNLYNVIENHKNKIINRETLIVPQNIVEAQKRFSELKEILESLKNVRVSFSIGSRSYYQKVVKIGKSYFDGNTKMTAGRGYYLITEIPEITENMRDEMISDSYYY